MPMSDTQRWNERYRQETYHTRFTEPRPFLVEHLGALPQNGLALDAPVGLGGNAGLLLAHGLRVVGVDISDVGLQRARAAFPALMAVRADLTRFYLPPGTFDVILNFYYLQRDLWPVYVRSLKPGGFLVFETLTQDLLALHPEVEPDFLLAPGELRRGFEQELEVLDYREGWTESDSGHSRSAASLLARKPGG